MRRHLFTFLVDLPDDDGDIVDAIVHVRQAIGDGVADLYDDNAFYGGDDDE